MPNHGQLASAPSAVYSDSAALHLVGRGLDDEVWIQTRFGGNWSGWAPLVDAGAGGRFAAGDPSITSWGTGHLDVLIESKADVAFIKSFDTTTGAWGPWKSIPGLSQINEGVSAVSAKEGRIELLVRGFDNQVYVGTYGATPPGGP